MRMKEFVAESGVRHVVVNVETDPERAKRLRDHHMLVPVAVLGDRFVDGRDLAELADLIGVDYERRDMLSPVELWERFGRLNQVFCSGLEQATPEALGYTFPGRELLWPEPEMARHGYPRRRRTILELANHAALLARAFLAAYYEDDYRIDIYRTPEGLGEVTQVDEVIQKAERSLALMATWWEEDGQDDPLEHVLETFVGYRTLHEILEREVWHTAQHVRQVNHVLELHGITPEAPLSDDDLRGLPTPAAIHA
jgi:hypothetical protein